MKKFALSNNWKMRQCGEEQWLTATVPGSVYSDYMNAGRLNDPFWRDNEDAFYELMKNDFEYQSSFVSLPLAILLWGLFFPMQAAAQFH